MDFNSNVLDLYNNNNNNDDGNNNNNNDDGNSYSNNCCIPIPGVFYQGSSRHHPGR